MENVLILRGGVAQATGLARNALGEASPVPSAGPRIRGPTVGGPASSQGTPHGTGPPPPTADLLSTFPTLTLCG